MGARVPTKPGTSVIAIFGRENAGNADLFSVHGKNGRKEFHFFRVMTQSPFLIEISQDAYL
jgi:hypothetical protein